MAANNDLAIARGATADLNGFDTQVDTLSGAGNLVMGSGHLTVNDGQFSGIASGTGNLTKQGAGTLVLDGTNTYTGGSSISGGTLQIGSGGATGSVLGDILDNGRLAVNRSDSYTFSGLVTGSGSLVQQGTGTLVLTADNSYAGGTTISAGRLRLGNGGTSGSLVGNVVDNGGLIVNRSDALTLAGVISGTGTLTKQGAGTLTLTGANTLTGGTTISAGTLALGNGGTSGSLTGNVVDNGTLAINRSDLSTLSGAISGSGSLVKQGAGTLILTGANTLTGGTTISAGTLALGNGGTSGLLTGNVVDNGTLAVNRSDALTLAGGISGSGSLVKQGAGTLVLTGANTLTGGTTISGGTLALGNGGTSGSLTGDVTDNGTLAINRSDALTFAGVISGTGSLTKQGAGTLALTGTNSFGGGTTISGGTLALGNGGTSGSLTGDVTDNGTLAINRSDALTLAGGDFRHRHADQAGRGHPDADRCKYADRRHHDQRWNSGARQWRHLGLAHRQCGRQWHARHQPQRPVDPVRRDLGQRFSGQAGRGARSF